MKESIYKVRGREVLDSRGNPAVEVEVETEGGDCAWAIVPSGASTGIHEAVELRDGGPRFHGRGVLKALSSVELIATEVVGLDVREQKLIDRLMIEMDGTENKSSLGGNAILGVSLACARAAAASSGKQLYEHVGMSEEGLLPVPFSTSSTVGSTPGTCWTSKSSWWPP